MRIVTHRLSGRHRSVADRVRQVADEAGRLASRHARSGLGNVELAVTTGRGIPDLVSTAHERIFNFSDWDAWDVPGVAGVTTIRRGGSLVIVNAEANRGSLAEADMTVIHELVHACQLTRTGAWELAARRHAHQYGIEFMTDREVRTAETQFVREEREAEKAERLASQLARAVA
ncbi:hypothetical protein MUK60_07485 [Streptomyces sp. LRE541]|uniref:hypothetical protein n=1 Tax=Streptomyces sp. LRE541 TaxID=2931983 RepID=UPI00200E5578|nr:hypothetical protein [Streptomyces sp. LRE541]UPZ27675.1 hypothetical protein MUK60_07485 [Streptomyces sp. LRE541]